MRRGLTDQATAAAAQRLIGELREALERSTRALIAEEAAELTAERDRWTRRVLRRIRMLSALIPTANVGDADSPSIAAATPTAAELVPAANPAAHLVAPLSTKDGAESSAPVPTPSRPARESKAAAAKRERNERNQVYRRAEQALTNWERFRTAFPDLDPFPELQAVKDRVFSSA